MGPRGRRGVGVRESAAKFALPPLTCNTSIWPEEGTPDHRASEEARLRDGNEYIYIYIYIWRNKTGIILYVFAFLGEWMLKSCASVRAYEKQASRVAPLPPPPPHSPLCTPTAKKEEKASGRLPETSYNLDFMSVNSFNGTQDCPDPALFSPPLFFLSLFLLCGEGAPPLLKLFNQLRCQCPDQPINKNKTNKKTNRPNPRRW